MKPVIITAALVGAELTKEKTPYLPVTPDEIAEAARLAVAAGAAILHLHVRDDQGRPTNDAERFREVLEKIKKVCRPTPILQVSTGGMVGDSLESRFQSLAVKPDMASLNAGSVNFGTEIFENPLPFVKQMATRQRDRDIKPEIEIYDLSHLETALQLIQEGYIHPPAHFQFVMGVALAATEQNLRLLVSRLPAGATWTVAGIGRHQFPMAELALQWGGHVRVGLEDNIYLEKGVLAKGSYELVEKAVALAQGQRRVVATVLEARKISGLS